LSKNSGSHSRTRRTISSTTTRASYGVSPLFTIRSSRCSTMPDTVCTIDVKAAIGMTYRAVSIARFSAALSMTCTFSVTTRKN